MEVVTVEVEYFLAEVEEEEVEEGVKHYLNVAL